MQGRGKLRDADFEWLTKSWIPPEVAEAARLFRVENEEASELGFGGKGHRDLAGVVFPNHDPSSGNTRGCRLRRDNPELERRDGILKPRAKYLSPSGQPNFLYFPPGVRPEWLQDAGLTIVIGEGEKKTLALHRLSWHELGEIAELPRFLAIGITGAWSWRGRRGKETGATGARVDVYDVIADVDRIEWCGRRVVLFPDSDYATNRSVTSGWNGFARELEDRRAIVNFAHTPTHVGNGPDDGIFRLGPEWGLEQIQRALGSDGPEAQRHPPAAAEGVGATVKDAAKAVGQNGSQATRLVAFTQGADIFHTRDGTSYATLAVGDHRETWPVLSRQFKRYLVKKFYEAERRAPNAQALRDAIATVDAKANFDGGHEEEVFVRVAEHGGDFYLDLADNRWRAVRVTSSGWMIVNAHPVRFRRTRGMLALPEPLRGGMIDELDEFVNVRREDKPLIRAWTSAAMRPRGPYPILNVHGEQGTAKSTTERVLRALVDPNESPLRTLPHDERDLQIAAYNSHLLAFDNVSYLQSWLSDALCRLATGAGLATRELFADRDEVIFQAQRPILLNGIEDLAAHGDFLQRSILIYLPEISETARRPEEEFWRAFEVAWPRILGTFLDAMTEGLRNVNTVDLERKPRMADFAIWAVAAEPALGLESGTFLRAYGENSRNANALALESSLVAPHICAFVDENEEWTGTASELLDEINSGAGERFTREKGWPKTARALSGLLRRLAPNLRTIGVKVIFLEREANRRLISLAKEPARASQPSEQSRAPSSVPSSEPSHPSPSGERAHDGCDADDGRAAAVEVDL